MSRATVLIFEVLEKAWASLDCSLVDMKIEFGVNTKGNLIINTACYFCHLMDKKIPFEVGLS